MNINRLEESFDVVNTAILMGNLTEKEERELLDECALFQCETLQDAHYYLSKEISFQSLQSNDELI